MVTETRLILTTNPGLEDIVVAELQLSLQRAELPEAVCELSPFGMAGAVDVRCETARDDLLAVAQTLRSIHHIHSPVGWIELTHPSGDPLAAISDFLREVDIPEMQTAKIFRVTGKRVGAHGFTSIDVQKKAGAALDAKYDCGVSMTAFDTNILVNVYHDHCYVAVQLTDVPLDMRYQYVFRPKVSLKANVAYALLHLADLRPADGVAAYDEELAFSAEAGDLPLVLLDPFCGSGTILLEAAACLPEWQVRGSDRYENAIGWSTDNVKANDFGARISLLQGDARDLRKLYPPHSVDVIITNPPFGAQLGANANFRALYTNFLRAAWGVLKPNGRIAMLVWKRRAFNEMVKKFDFEIRHVRIVDMGGIYPGVFVLQKKQS